MNCFDVGKHEFLYHPFIFLKIGFGRAHGRRRVIEPELGKVSDLTKTRFARDFVRVISPRSRQHLYHHFIVTNSPTMQTISH
jgi:hypothetical protein